MWCVPQLDQEYLQRMEAVLEVLNRPLNKHAPVVALDERPVPSTAIASLFSASGAPRNCTRDATISVRWRLPPLFFASNSRVRRRPST